MWKVILEKWALFCSRKGKGVALREETVDFSNCMVNKWGNPMA